MRGRFCSFEPLVDLVGVWLLCGFTWLCFFEAALFVRLL